MNNGCFFKLRHSSDLSEKYILFSYTGIKSKKGEVHPVFLVFNEEQIDFYFSGVIKKENGEEKNQKGEKKVTDIDVPYPEFVENHLFSLNLHKGKENVLQLDESLKDLFDLIFPVIDEIVIYNGEDHRYKNKSNITYADLEVFQKTKSGNTVTGKKILYKTLILDFLFDVYHSNVFENSPAFTQIKQHLDEIPMIQAIKRKAEFYYQVQNNKSKAENRLITFDTSNSLYIKKLIRSQEDWLEILQEQDSNKFIKEDNRWFKDVETEVKELLVNQLTKKDFDIIIQKNESKNEENIKDKKQLHGKNLWKQYHKFLIEQKSSNSRWFIKRNNIIDAWSTFTKLKHFGVLIFLMVGIYLSGFIFLIEDKPYYSFVPITKFYLLLMVTLFILGFIIFYIIDIFLYFISVLHHTKKLIISVGSKSFPIYIFIELLMIPFIILILTSSFVTFELTSYGNRYFIFNKFSLQGVLFPLLLSILIIIILVIIGSIINNNIKNKNNSKPFLNFKKVFSVRSFQFVFVFVILMAIVFFFNFFGYSKNINEIYSFTTSFNKLFLSNLTTLFSGLLKSGLSGFFSVIFSILLLSLTFIILYIDEKKRHPNLMRRTSFRKVFSLLLIGLLISFFSNLIVLNYSYKDFLDKYSLIDEIWKNAFDKTGSIPYNTEDTFSKLKFKTSHLSDSTKIKIKGLIHEKESSHVDAEKEEYFYLPLEQLKIFNTKSGKELYPVLKKINIFGFEIITLPSVLFINTFLTLLLAVLIQVVLNHKKFLEGGKT